MYKIVHKKNIIREIKRKGFCIIKNMYSKKEINGIKLSNHLTTYSEIGEKYVLYLKQIIDHNSLTDFDKSILLPTNKHNQAQDEKIPGIFDYRCKRQLFKILFFIFIKENYKFK